MAKVCPKCGREFGSSSTRCPICKIDLVSDGIDNSEHARMERLERLRQQQSTYQNVQARTAQTRTQQLSSPTQAKGKARTESPEKDGPSGLSITALVFSLLGCLSIVGLVLGIVDLCINKHRKKVCSILSLVFSGLWIIGMSAFIGETDTPKRTNTASSISSQAPSNNIGGIDSRNIPQNESFGNNIPQSISKEVEETAKPAEIEKQQPAYSDAEFDYNDMHVKYIGHEVTENDYGDSRLVVYFEFTNNSDENEAFLYSFNAKVFQNGMALEDSLIFTNDICRNRNNEIQPGTTITLGCDFALRGDMSNVTLQIEPLISFSENILMQLELSLQ